MAKPDVLITIGAGGLGRIEATEDGTAGIIVSGVAVAGKFALGDVLEVQSLQQAIDLGIDSAYDLANTVLAYQHISDFYDEAAVGTTLFVMVVADTVTMAEMALKTNQHAKKLLAEANGAINILVITRVADAGYVPSYTDEMEDDVLACITNAQALAVEEAAAPYHRPVQVIIEGRNFQGNATASHDLRALAADRVSVVLGQSTGEAAQHARAANYAFAGYVAGRLSSIPVQRNIGRVKSGQLSKQDIGLSNGAALSTFDELKQGTLHDHGYILAWQHAGLAGYFFSDDPTCVAITSDFASIGRGRVMDKAARITRGVLLNELLDDVEMNADTGRLEVSVIKGIQGSVETNIAAQMTSTGEISGASVYIDPDQNVLSTDKIAVELKLVPKGIARNITALIEFQNPLS